MIEHYSPLTSDTVCVTTVSPAQRELRTHGEQCATQRDEFSLANIVLESLFKMRQANQAARRERL